VDQEGEGQRRLRKCVLFISQAGLRLLRMGYSIGFEEVARTGLRVTGLEDVDVEWF
jgi:hypothetical protein